MDLGAKNKEWANELAKYAISVDWSVSPEPGEFGAHVTLYPKCPEETGKETTTPKSLRKQGFRDEYEPISHCGPGHWTLKSRD